MTEQTSLDYLEWAKRANARWIVHHDLSRNAESYIAHLAKEDPSRLVPSCRNAYLMVWLRDPMEDPKPWFYSGLFSLSTPTEAQQFLANHWLTRCIVHGDETKSNSVDEATRQKIRRIREAMAKLPDDALDETVSGESTVVS